MKQKRCLKRSITRMLAMLLAVFMVLNGSGMTAFAEELDDVVSDVTEGEAAEDSTESSEAISDSEEIEEESSEELPEELPEVIVAEDDESVSDEKVAEEASEWKEEAEDTAETKAEMIAKGDWGESVHWTLDSDGVLTITQDEGVENEYFSEEAPWTAYASDVKTLIWGANCLKSDGENVFSAIQPGQRYYGEVYFENLESVIFLENVKMEHITDFSYLFAGNTKLVNISFGDFNTSAATNMSFMFNGCKSLMNLDMSPFVTNNVTDMEYIFAGCNSLTFIELSEFDTTNVTNMGGMFWGCHNLSQINLSHFNTSKVTDMSGMFAVCKKITDIDISHLDTSNVTDMGNMFYECENLKRIKLGNINTSKVTDMNSMFNSCEELESIESGDLDTSKVESMSAMFAGCTKLVNLDVTYFETERVTEMYSMFSGCENLTSLDISGFDTSNVGNMDNMFSGCKKLTSLDVSGFDTSNVSNMTSMFSGCEKLTSLDVSGFDTSWVSSIASMFSDCSKLESIDVSGFDTSNVENMGFLFKGCSSLEELDVSGFDTSEVTYMGYMFYDCNGLEVIDVSDFDTSSVEDFERMFYGCNELKSIDVSRFDTSESTNMRGMFSGCSSLTSLDVSGFETEEVIDMSDMFSNCASLLELNLKSFNSEKVYYIGDMFSGCESLQKLDLSNFKLDSLFYNYNKTMFEKCGSLETIKTPTHVRSDISLVGIWKRLDTNEMVTMLPKYLEQSVELEINTEVVAVTDISLYVTDMKLDVQHSYQLLYSMSPSYATNKEVEWSSSDSGVVSVSSDGTVTTHRVGKATVTVKALGGNDVVATCSIEVAQLATEVQVALEHGMDKDGYYILAVGERTTPVVEWINGEEWSYSLWTDYNGPAIIEGEELVAQKAGTGILRVESYQWGKLGPSASLNYRVYEGKVSGITLNTNKVVLDAQNASSSFLLEATIDNSDEAYSDIKFTTDKPAMVNIQEHGNNTATISLLDFNPGTATVTATATDGSGKSATCTVVSRIFANSISVTSSLAESEDGTYLLSKGNTAKFTAEILPTNATEKSVTWKSSDENIIKVAADGTVTAVNYGLAYVYATATDGSEVSGSTAVLVSRQAKSVKMTVGGLEGGKVRLREPGVNAKFQIYTSVLNENGNTDGVLQDVEYVISGKNAKGVIYLGDGKFEAIAPGAVTISATAQDGSGVKTAVSIVVEQQVYAFDVQAPKNIGNYVAEDGEHWIVYAGKKDVTLTPSVKYNNGDKAYAPAKEYQKYTFVFDEAAKGNLSINKKGTGIVVSKNAAGGSYSVKVQNENSGIFKQIYVDVVKADEVYIKDVSIAVPKNVEAVEQDTYYFAEGSKIKLTGVLNGGEKTNGYTLTWNVEDSESNQGKATITKAGMLDLSGAKSGDNYNVALTISRGEESSVGKIAFTVKAKPDSSAMKLVLAEDEKQVLPDRFNVQYGNNGKVFKVANQNGAANLYSVTSGKKGVLAVEETDGGYVVTAEGTGSAKITITALDGSNVKKAIAVKIVPAGNAVSKITTGSKKYSMEPNKPIAIPFAVATKNGKAASDARVEWTSSNPSVLKVAPAAGMTATTSCITNEERGYLTLVSEKGMIGKVTLTGKALDGSKKTVKVSINVVSRSKKEVTYGLTLQTPANTPNGGVAGLALLTHGKKVKLTTNVIPGKAKNKTISYSVVGVDSNGKQILGEADLKAKGITVKKGVVTAAKKSTYTGYVKVTAKLDYMTYSDGVAHPIEASKTLYVQPGVTKVELTDASGTVVKAASAEAGKELVLKAKVTGAGTLTYANVSWSVNNAKLASVDANGRVTIKADAAKGKKVKVTATALDGSKKKAVVTITVK